jgi:hypothetical protein
MTVAIHKHLSWQQYEFSIQESLLFQLQGH